MTMQPVQPSPSEELAARAWINLDTKGKTAALEAILDEGGDRGEEMLNLYQEQLGVIMPPPAEREANYLSRPLGNWETLKVKYRKFFNEDLRDFRKLNPQAADMLELTLLMLEAQALEGAI